MFGAVKKGTNNSRVINCVINGKIRSRDIGAVSIRAIDPEARVCYDGEKWAFVGDGEIED